MKDIYILQENQLPAAAEGVEFMSPRYRPSSLPSLSLPLSPSQDHQSMGSCLEHQLSTPQTMGESRDAKTRSLCGQISSPLVRENNNLETALICVIFLYLKRDG